MTRVDLGQAKNHQTRLVIDLVIYKMSTYTYFCVYPLCHWGQFCVKNIVKSRGLGKRYNDHMDGGQTFCTLQTLICLVLQKIES